LEAETRGAIQALIDHGVTKFGMDRVLDASLRLGRHRAMISRRFEKHKSAV
jgi:hypothetical protein